MKSIVEEALARHKAFEAHEEPPETHVPVRDTKVDSELREILSKLKTNIRIVGCGGGGCNTVSRIAEEGIAGAELFATNTDAQHLLSIRAPRKILLGRRCTRGLGAGAMPMVGEEAARETKEELAKSLGGSDVVFVTCGLGGGTGTGGAGVISKVAKDSGALVVALVTLPFRGEGRMRMENAEWGLERLRKTADTVICIPNDKLVELYPRLPLNTAFRVADEVLMRSIKGLTEVVSKPGLINLDFNDFKTIMKGAGVAMIGLGESEAPAGDRALEAISEAINSPLLDVDITSANGILVNVVGGEVMSVSEAEKVAEVLQTKVSGNARIIWGATVDPTMENKIRVMVVATGVTSKQIVGHTSAVERKRTAVEMVH
ncbi:MAG: cell division protein FtsZ [Methanobacteriota archaeon]|nr:MAG: cell division protein FtsZ [Euryarchaeota archaeon]